jgi:hypothetical protein
MATKQVKVRVIVERSTVYEQLFDVPDHMEVKDIHEHIEQKLDANGVEGWDEFAETTFSMKIDEVFRV